MFDDWLRARKDLVFASVACHLARFIHPNVITICAVVAGLVTAVLAARGAWMGALAGWLINRALDGLDGSVARAGGRSSDFGGYLDLVLDFVVYAAIPVALVIHDPTPAVWRAGLLLLAAFYVNSASWMVLSAILERRRHGAEANGTRTTVVMPRGIVAGAETVLFYALFFVWPRALPQLFSFMSALVGGNVLVRLWWARRHLT